MFVPLLLSGLLFVAPPSAIPVDAVRAGAVSRTEPGAPARQDLTAEFEKRRAAAEGDAQKLWEVANWCEANGLDKEFRSCLRAILKIDDGDKKAHELLGHVFYDGQWFPSAAQMEAYKKKHEAELRKDEERKAKEQGLVRHGDRWVHPEDVPYLERGFVKDESGTWIDPEEQKKLAEGWVRQDLEWISPEEKPNLEKGLWKCGDRWLGLADADAYHAEIDRCWKIPGERFLLYSTCPRSLAQRALLEAEDAYGDLVRIFGTYPAERPHFVVLNSLDQYGRFANGDPAAQRPGTESAGLSSVHGVFFADVWFAIPSLEYLGAGVTYWDEKDERSKSFGRLFARHAAAQSFIERIDPSPATTVKFREAQGAGGFSPADFWKEKLLPLWLRYGAAAYVERYFADKSPGAASNPHMLREWSVQNIQRAGGLDPLDTIFAFGITVENSEGSGKLINEAGLLVAFLLDGGCAPLAKEHGVLKEAIRQARQDQKKAPEVQKVVANIQKLFQKNEEALRKFAKL
ncbi:MAG: hypothetical protein AB1726_16435 [Planctomycetota bacterium]